MSITSHLQTLGSNHLLRIGFYTSKRWLFGIFTYIIYNIIYIYLHYKSPTDPRIQSPSENWVFYIQTVVVWDIHIYNIIYIYLHYKSPTDPRIQSPSENWVLYIQTVVVWDIHIYNIIYIYIYITSHLHTLGSNHLLRIGFYTSKRWLFGIFIYIYII